MPRKKHEARRFEYAKQKASEKSGAFFMRGYQPETNLVCNLVKIFYDFITPFLSKTYIHATGWLVAKKVGFTPKYRAAQKKQKTKTKSGKEQKMSEQLLTPEGVAKKLRISRTTFYDLRPRLIANGIKTMKVGKNIKYLESSIDALIKRCAETGQPMA